MKTKYKNSNLRLALLLVQFSVIVYTLIEGDETARILAGLILGMWILAAKSWMEE